MTSVIEIQAQDRPLGRLASDIARELQGKTLPSYTPHQNPRRRVVVWNVSQLRLGARKGRNSYRYHFSGYPGGLKKARLIDIFNKTPERVLREAVRRMLPKNKLQTLYLQHLTLHNGPKS